jgi:hypothetical protein
MSHPTKNLSVRHIGILAICAAMATSAALAAEPAAGQSGGAAQVAGELVVSLDARDASAGTTNWMNKGTMGNFTRIGAPKVTTTGGQPAVAFDGKADGYRSEKQTPDTITGAHARSIEVWVNNPSLDSAEECMIAWGHRGAALADMGFNYGSDAGYSAVTHYDQDMSWGDESPEAGKWHLLTYTYDGKTAKIYDNGVERASQEFKLATAPDTHLNIGVANSAEDKPIFESEFDSPWQLALSGSIAAVRVHTAALTAEQVKANFAADKDRFGAKAPSAD